MRHQEGLQNTVVLGDSFRGTSEVQVSLRDWPQGEWGMQFPVGQELTDHLYPRTHPRLWGLWPGGGGHGSWPEPFAGHDESGSQDAEM